MSTDRPSGQVTHALNSLADLRLSEETLDSILGHIGRLGLQTLDGWDAVGTTLVERKKVATYGLTDDRLATIDQAQYESGRGPCVDALATGESRYFNGEVDEPRWRQFAESAADQNVYSVMSFPLTVKEEVIGAMNFYSGERDAMRSGQREEGLLFAGQAAVALANAREFQVQGSQIEHLQQGLQTRTMIGQASGLLMAQEGLTAEEAFQKLVAVSQNANIKLRDVAQRYVEAWERQATRAEKSQDSQDSKTSKKDGLPW